jgi:hypothetical protein
MAALFDGPSPILERAAARGPQDAHCLKELYWIDGASHNGLRDTEQYLGPTIAKLSEFYAANLGEPAVAKIN